MRREIGYLHRTLHPSHDDGETPYPRFEASMRRHFADGARYLGLSILDSSDEDVEGVSKVLFIARVAVRGRDRSFAEVSSFARVGGHIRYLTGITMPVVRVRDLAGPGAIALAEARARGPAV